MTWLSVGLRKVHILSLTLHSVFLNAIPGLSLKWKLILHPYLYYWFRPKKPAKYSEQDFLKANPTSALVLMAMDNGEELDLPSLSVSWRECWNKAQ